MKRARAYVLVLFLILSSGQSSHAQSALATSGAPTLTVADPFAWLEDIGSKRSVDWASTHSAHAFAELTADANYEPLYRDIRRALDVHDTISYPQIIGDRIYNLSRDESHRRGVWRWTTSDRYLHKSTTWTKVLDLDSLAVADDVAWEFVGAECPDVERWLCILELDHAGPGTPVFRAFEVDARRFVNIDATLAVTTTRESRVARIELPNDEARLEQEPGKAPLPDNTLRPLNRHPSADGDVYMVRDQVIVHLHQPWSIGSTTWPAGDIVATSLADFVGARRQVSLVMAPGNRERIKSVAAVRDYLIVNLLSNVSGEIRRYRHERGVWRSDDVQIPTLGTADLISTSTTTNNFFFSFTSFLQPTTLYLADDDGRAVEVRRLPGTFEASKFVAEQGEAASSDGTRIPFFIVRPRDMRWDGQNPTLLYGYGGFELSCTPAYGTAIGPAWISRGGVYVVANIRGGGEFGPDWHTLGIRENRQRVYDDFIAVAKELIRLGVTSPPHLGIIGSSNGGLLAAVALTQHPELFGGAVVQSGLLDMRSFARLGGAQWIPEYGNPEKPEEWAYIAKYSPYENLRSTTSYPAVMLETNMRDERVHPAHARKMAAKMESMGLPVYYFENTEGGHVTGLNADQRARTLALAYTFLWQHLRRSLNDSVSAAMHPSEQVGSSGAARHY